MPRSDAARPGLPCVVILGGGFAGLEAARALRGAPVRVVLVDRRNHHLFQPLLYQVASATLSPADIAAPIRHVLRHQGNAEVRLGEAVGVDPAARTVRFAEGGDLAYDFLVVATGARHSYFGRDGWGAHAPGLKTLEDALEIRRRFLLSFERAELETDPARLRELLTYVVVGGGPTGVELAGTLKEMARLTLPREFRRIHANLARVVLVEAGPDILPAFGQGLTAKARRSLEAIGVEVRTGEAVTGVDAHGVTVGRERIDAGTVIWAAGVEASPLGRSLGVPLDRAGRVVVAPDLSIPGHGEIFVIGDLASFSHGLQGPLPGLGAVAIQQGRAAARNLLASVAGEPRSPFQFRDRGTMATIGRGSAIAQLGPLRLSGWVAWLAWLFVHLMLLVGFRNRVAVFMEWLFAYLTTQRRVRLILGASRDEAPPSG
ncbi:NAD(P)/FAD-dependent oxidoreductase [Mesoterricola silvestris]|uniref:NADH dehydrogenase n=1 Tax=Mesoterricola silvestris TaxID=2927979 RepID=A0AA48GP96_9BACT|nr:NAD(P)/FAD-dependent oxidoreductase [Mesoterricola silvestris]BDU73589.1 NADH dehydrogenase [Mesoterricola silvestris]